MVEVEDLRVRSLRHVRDPLERARQAGELAAAYRSGLTELARLQREALEELVAQGMSTSQLAATLGMPEAQVEHLLAAGPRIERAFLGTATLTVVLSSRRDVQDGRPGPPIEHDDLPAYKAFERLAGQFDLETRPEVIQPPGMVDLNRDNLVVMCPPRVSPLIVQALSYDQVLGFREDTDDRWFLQDTNERAEYRSPLDVGEPRDFAYVGRLPRLDGRGSFLYIAGIHSIGTAGAVHFIEQNLLELYRELGTRQFSTVIRCTFDPETRAIRSSERVAPLYDLEFVKPSRR